MNAKSLLLPLGIAAGVMAASSLVGGLVMLIPGSAPTAQQTPYGSASPAIAVPASAAAPAVPSPSIYTSRPWAPVLTSDVLVSLTPVAIVTPVDPDGASATGRNYCGASPLAPLSGTNADPIPINMEFFCQVDLAELPSGLSFQLPQTGVLQLFRSTNDRAAGFVRVIQPSVDSDSLATVAETPYVNLSIEQGVYPNDASLVALKAANPTIEPVPLDPDTQGLNSALAELGYPVGYYGMGGEGTEFDPNPNGYVQLFELLDGEGSTGYFMPAEDMVNGRFDRITVERF
jgi:Domain of unknown function (DUF1963)